MHHFDDNCPMTHLILVFCEQSMALTNVLRQALLSGTMAGVTQPRSSFRVMHILPVQPNPSCAEELSIGIGAEAWEISMKVIQLGCSFQGWN